MKRFFIAALLSAFAYGIGGCPQTPPLQPHTGDGDSITSGDGDSTNPGDGDGDSLAPGDGDGDGDSITPPVESDEEFWIIEGVF